MKVLKTKSTAGDFLENVTQTDTTPAVVDDPLPEDFETDSPANDEALLETPDTPDEFESDVEDQAVDFLQHTETTDLPGVESVDDGTTVSVDKREYDDNMVELNYLRDKVEFFRSLLRGVFYRSDEEIEADVGRACQAIERFQYPALIKDFLKRTYSESFWHNEPDVRYKMALAKGLRDVVRSRDPSTKYAPLETIVNGKAASDFDATYEYLMDSYIER